MMAAKTKKQQSFWIKERDNPQLGTYYVACGQLSRREAREMETGSLYGSNVMLEFETQTAYDAKLDELREQGANLQYRA